MKQRRPPEERFFDKVDLDHPSGCWVWTAAPTKGYGVFWRGPGQGTVQAHCWAYEFFYGTYPKRDDDGTLLTIDHECRNPSCVKPTHLALVTHTENVLRGRAAEAQRQRHAERTHCKQGHEFTPENTRVRPEGEYLTRQCRACNRDSARRYRSRRPTC